MVKIPYFFFGLFLLGIQGVGLLGMTGYTHYVFILTFSTWFVFNNFVSEGKGKDGE